jgi:murein DD-endopeptidase MepM/ murein hydrolase activator NlpD
MEGKEHAGMAFTPAAGQHSRSTRSTRSVRTRVGIAGVAALAAVGVLGSLASPAAAASGAEAEQRTGFGQATVLESAAAAKRGNGYVAPVPGASVTTPYRAGGSMWASGSHSGIDFAASSGTSVRAVGAGTVAVAGWGGAYGNNIVIRHGDGRYTQYGHLSAMDVHAGQSVKAGQRIGRVGSTGNSTGPHLHFEARTTPNYGSDMNPVTYLRSKGVRV